MNNINEDIKILQESLESVGEEYDVSKEKQSLENLIKGYRDSEDIMKNAVKENLELKEYIRELEEENKHLKEYIVVAPNLDEMTAVKYANIQEEAYIRGRAEEQQKAKQIIYEHYIPKSKVKEKIEELKKMNLDCDTFGSMRDYSVLILKELMEDK